MTRTADATGHLGCTPAEAFYLTPHPTNALQLASGTPPLSELTKAVHRVGHVVRESAW